jgi:8-oxo-dGTP pyrophosphatase MutT (NUDIX family)
MKNFFTGLLVLSVFGINGAAHKGFTVSKTPKYRDTLIKVTGWCNKDDLFAEVAKQKASFFVELPLASAGLSATLVEKYGMKFYHADEKRIKYVKSIGSVQIPPLLTSVIAVKVFISRMHEGQLQVLFTEENRTRLAASLPGGTADYNESALDAARRELQEELGLKVARKAFKIIGFLDRTDAFAECVSRKELQFQLPYDGQEIICDGKEVEGFFWANIKEVLRTGKANGLIVLPHHMVVLKGLSEGKQGKPCMIMPDHRQLSPQAKEDPNDIMIFFPVE